MVIQSVEGNIDSHGKFEDDFFFIKPVFLCPRATCSELPSVTSTMAVLDKQQHGTYIRW